MSESKQDVKRKFQNLSDYELMDVFEVESNEYTDEELLIALEVVEERGGIKRITKMGENGPEEIEMISAVSLSFKFPNLWEKYLKEHAHQWLADKRAKK